MGTLAQRQAAIQITTQASSMKQRYALIALLLCFLWTTKGSAQPGSRPGGPPARSVKGQVIDADSGRPLEYATLTLYALRDSSMVTGGISDASGQLNIQTRPGRYWARIEFLGYQTLDIPQIDLGKGKTMADLGKLSLLPDAQVLAEVEVRAEKSELQFALDKKVFNVGKDLANTTSSVAELLDNVPSVAVDIDGGVTLRGSGNVRILIDGKPSGLIGVGDTDGLRAIPSNLIERVEVITNPSARYEATGTTGIINIVLRKERKKGLNGSFDATVGVPAQLGAAINLNYRRESVNLFFNYGLRWNNNPGGGSSVQEFFRGDTTFLSQQNRGIDRSGLSNNFRFGADYFLGKKSTLTAAFTYRLGNEDNLSELEYLDFINSLDNLILRTDRSDDELEDEQDGMGSLNFRRTFDREGQELTVDFQYERSGEIESSELTERYFNPDNLASGDPNLQQRTSIDESNTEWLLKADYVHPFGGEGKFEAGYRGSLRQIRNDYKTEERNDEGWQTLERFTNSLIYDENIQAVYLSLGNKHGKFSYQAGLRAEYTDIQTRLLKTGETNPRDFLNLFPSANLTYDLPAQNAIQFSYSRRITRPRFWYLNSFLTFSDARNLFQGNPDLNPEFTHALELGHLKYFGSGSISSSIYYRYTDGKIDRIRDVESNVTAFITPENLLSENAFGLEFTYNFTLAKWWRTNGDFNFFRSIVDGSNFSENFSHDDYSWSTQVTNRWTIGKGCSSQLRFRYIGPIETTQGLRKAIYNFDLGISLDVFRGKGTLTLNARDLFNTRVRRYITEGDNFRVDGDFQWRSRQISLNLNYRLNQKKKRGRPRGNYGGDGGGFY